MKFFKNIKQGMQLNSMLKNQVSDGKISDEELGELADFIDNAEMPAVKIKEIIIQNLNRLGKRIEFDDEQEKIIVLFFEKLNIQYSEVPELAVKLLDYHATKIYHGISPIPRLNGNPIILQQDEEPYFVINVFTTKEKTVAHRIKGSSAGVSFRVAKGVTLRTGGSQGRIVRETKQTVDTKGEFIVTNQRVIYKNNKRNIEIPIGRILDFNIGENEIEIFPSRGNSLYLNVDSQAFSAYYLQVILSKLTGMD